MNSKGKKVFGILEWLDDRTGLLTLLNRLVSGQVERNGAWLRTSGFACLILVIVECVTGPILALYYTASPNAAYASILAIEENPLGRFLRGLHHWASATLILLALFTIIRMFFGGEYKGGDGRRRDVVWIAALLFFQFVLLLQVTGHLMPWDTNAVKTADVEAGIGGNVWVFGPLIRRFLLGGGSTGMATLTRWYGFHTMLLPLLLLLLVGLPLFGARLRQAEKQSRNDASLDSRLSTLDSYYPFHMAREMLVALAIFLIVAGLAWFGKTPLEKEATAANLDGYQAMSEWYVLPMHAATLMPPFNNVTFEPLATLVLPGLLFTVLIVLPFLDRNPERSLKQRPFAAAAGGIVLLSTLGLYLFAVVTERPAGKDAEKAPPIDAKLGNVVPAQFDTALVEKGKAIYTAQGCNSCHAIAGKGGNMGPDLTHAGRLHGDREWQTAHLIKPDSKTPKSTMPPYPQLKPDEMKALVEYMVSLQ